MEIKLGEINEDKDHIEHAEQLLNKVSYRFYTMNIDQDGNTCMTIDQFLNDTFSSNENNSMLIPNNETDLMIFFLIGDIKGLFQVIYRSGHDSSFCMLCKCTPKV